MSIAPWPIGRPGTKQQREDLAKAEAVGFAPASLHPLQRTAYQQLLVELDKQ